MLPIGTGLHHHAIFKKEVGTFLVCSRLDSTNHVFILDHIALATTGDLSDRGSCKQFVAQVAKDVRSKTGSEWLFCVKERRKN